MRGALAAVLGKRAAVGKTDADFKAHIATLATNGVAAWTQGFDNQAGTKFRVTTAAKGGTMFGTVWQSYATADSAVRRAVQHGLPSEAALDAQIAAGREVYFEISNIGGVSTFTALDRNGYGSGGGALTADGYAVIDLIYWDGTAAWRMNPSTGTGPTPYAIP